MTKEQYLFLLQAELNGLIPQEELEDILRFYNEYFEEAGPEQERNVMLELGSPQRLAEKILDQRRAEKNSFDDPEIYIPSNEYYSGTNAQSPKWFLAILFGIAGVVMLPTLGGLVLGFGLGGIGCMLGGAIAVVVGSVGFGLAGKFYVVGGGLIAFAVGLLLFIAAAALFKLTLQAVRHCWGRITEGGEVYDEAGY